MADVHRDGVIRADRLLVPNRGIDVVDGEHLAGVLYKQQQNIVLDRGQLDRIAIDGDLLRVIVHDETATGIDIFARCFTHVAELCVPAQLRLYAGHQLERIVRLREIVIGTDIETEDLIVILSLCGEHDDRNRACFTYLQYSVYTIESRHHHIDDQKINFILFHDVQYIIAIVGF